MIIDLQSVSPSECLACPGDGYLEVYDDHLQQSVAIPCPSCNYGDAGRVLFRDQDGDGWADRIHRTPAKYAGRRRSMGSIDTLVLHRLNSGRWGAGPRYVANPDRIVSWHYTIHEPHWLRPVTQHLPLTSTGFHCRGLNPRSIGFEVDGSHDASYHEQTLTTLVDLVDLMMMCCPLRRIVSHASQDPTRRTDPEGFPWERLRYTGLELVH